MSEQKILAFSGRKQSGKNTSCNFITGGELCKYGIVTTYFVINPEGELVVGDFLGDDRYAGQLDMFRDNPEFLTFANNELFPYVKIYSCADLLKKEVCMKVLGLTREQCYGSDADKNTLTHLKWEDMPGVVTTLPDGFDAPGVFNAIQGRLGEYYHKHNITGIIYHPPGQMTAREVLQFVGTDIFRKMYGNVWIEALIRQIKKENSLFALICDVRFPNEVEGVQAAGGKVIRLTRAPFADTDEHASETALDNYPIEKYDAVIDNANMNINEQNSATHDVLASWGWAPEINQES